MHTQVSQQLLASGIALLCGVGAGIFYDVLRAVRRRAKSAFVTAVCDVLFVAVCFAVLFSYGMTAGGGRQRLYGIALAAIGGGIYFLTVSRFILWFFEKILDLSAQGVRFAVKPVKKAGKNAKNAAIFIKNLFQKRKK